MNIMENKTFGQKLQVETNKTSIERFTICYVIKKGYFNLVRYLLNLGKDPNERDSGNSCRTALIYCTFIRDEDWALSIAQNLLEFGAMLHLTDSNNLSPIHYCAAYGLDKLLDLFLRSLDFDISKICDKNGNNALHYALQNKNNSCTRLLIEKCCQCKLFGICDKNKFGVSPINLIQPFDQKKKFKELKTIKTNDQSFFTTELIDLSESSSESIKHGESEDLYKYMDILVVSKPIDTNKRRISDTNNNKFLNNLDENIKKSNDCMKYLELRQDHLISYNKLFYKKEDLFKNLEVSNRKNLECNPNFDQINSWRPKISNIFEGLESILSSSYRDPYFTQKIANKKKKKKSKRQTKDHTASKVLISK